uniref:DUF5600 domain-containing protein n=1 Tax=Panagrolaimus sp. ES5 TaxID=591445 RepID=A0AC34G7J9_9BILA
MLFDTSKLDISDEYKLVLQHLKGNEEKIKIVLNKADCVDPGELVRVRGALMWSLSKIMTTPEVPKVFIGSFSIPNKNTKNSEVLNLFKDDYADLFKELERLPIQHLSRKMWYKTEKQRALMLRDKKLKAIFLDIKLKYRMAESDMPDYESFKDLASKSYLKSWNKINPKMLVKLEEFLMKDVTK